mmetsp:Transcript_38876/g.58403  ORF Transcript_38876/g.58403 Transcript_38876/m.58403 type:complete len:723 (-) Transcript_38876:451-2619(-)
MRFCTATVALAVASFSCVAAFAPPITSSFAHAPSLRDDVGRSLVAAAVQDETAVTTMDYGEVNRLTYRELQRVCKEKGLAATGTTSALRSRLLDFFGTTPADLAGAAAAAAVTAADECVPDDITFCDESNPDFEFNSLLKEVMQKSEMRHWKAATRKLKQLKKRYATPDRPIPQDAYLAVLEACVENRLHGARAAEPARKILEEMSEAQMEIPINLGNSCVVNCLGIEESGKHDGCGGIDTALAMLAAIEDSPSGSNNLNVETYGAVVSALSRDGSVDEAMLLLRAMVVEKSFTPPLSVLADVGKAAAKCGDRSEDVLQVLALAKASGYELDSIGSAEAGRDLLASGVIAAEQMGNLALGLRLLTAASKAEGCAPDRGDDLVAASSSAAQRACTLIHKRAINTAFVDNNWKLAVKLLELMPERSLTPSTSVWRKVVTVCAKSEKSKKASAVLFDWVQLWEEGKVEQPPLSIFNAVVNACEICGEEDLTLQVLESMKKTHDTEGNIITTNIALKRLAKLGQSQACEGIIIGMLQEGIEPTVVSYTTAIGACAKEGSKNPELAYQWLQRMRSRNVMPNFHTYNTALAACLDGKLESTVTGSKIAVEMLAAVNQELRDGLVGSAEYKSALPDTYTKYLARELMKQLRDNWRAGDINMQVAKSTIRVPLLKLVDFTKSDSAEEARKMKEKAAAKKSEDVDDTEDVEKEEEGVVYSSVSSIHRRMEV